MQIEQNENNNDFFDKDFLNLKLKEFVAPT